MWEIQAVTVLGILRRPHKNSSCEAKQAYCFLFKLMFYSFNCATVCNATGLRTLKATGTCPPFAAEG